MNFPISSPINPRPYGNLTGSVLKIDGNGGCIPPAFQYAITTEEGQLCSQGVSPMNPEQWSAWGNEEPDEKFILQAVADNEGLELA